ncbi:MAG TPA: right-handed parallel beta-helix repeat-containing protein [Flavobacterium sp.]
MKKTSLLILLLLIGFNLSAADYYASPTGTGDGSSYSNPGSFANGKNALATVDRLYLLGGVYNLNSKQTFSIPGTAGNYKVICSYPGEVAILDFSAQPYGAEVTGSDNIGISISEGVQYLHFKDIVLRYAGKAGILNQGKNCTFENCEVYGCGDTGIQMKRGGNNLIKNCDSYSNFDYKSVTGTLANYGGNADGFADKQYTTPVDLNDAPNTYIGCRAWNNSDDGWDFYQRIGTSIITDCIAYKNGPTHYDMSTNPRRLGVDKTWFDAFEGAGKTVVDRYGNTVTTTVANYVNLGNGNGFKVGGDFTAHNVTLNRCLAVGNSANGFDKNNNAGNIYIYNGTSYKNNANYGFGNVNYATLTIKNSVSLESVKADSFSVITLVTDHNSWNTGGITCNAADFLSTDISLILQARNADGSLPVNDFLRLAPGSDLIDAGIDAKIGYSGAAPDLGCYETGVIDQYPGVVSNPLNKNQSVVLGTAISDIVYTWSGGATGLTVSGLPAGINQVTDNSAKTLTLSGTVTDLSNTYTYTVSTVDGTAIPDVVTGKIVVYLITAPSNKNQIVSLGNPIQNIVFSWTGDATGLTVSGLPAGLTSSLDTTAKTLTISGITTAGIGSYDYTVTTTGGTGSDSATATIRVIAAFDTTKYYNIYSYGIASNQGNSTSSLADIKRFMTGDSATNSVILVNGTSDSLELTNGTPDPLRSLAAAQWIISEGTTPGLFTIKNRLTGTYLQAGSTLSASAVQLNPVYKKDDNGLKAYAIFDAANTKCIQVNPPAINTNASYADRTRMRWVFAESGDINLGVNDNTVETKSEFLKYTLVSDAVELSNPEDFNSFEIFNSNVQKVISGNVTEAKINTSGLPVGVYIVKGIAKDGNVYVTKIFKK